MKILFLSSEATGLIKTGGLADVARALLLALRQKGHDVNSFFLIISPLQEPKLLHCSLLSGGSNGNPELFCAVQQTELEVARLPY